MANGNGSRELAGLIWSIAELLRGDYKQADYGKVILPFTVIRRLDCVLESTKQAVLDAHKVHRDRGAESLDAILRRTAKQSFYNTSKFTFKQLLDDPANIAANMSKYVTGFSSEARDALDSFKVAEQIAFLGQRNLLYLVIQRLASIDLHPDIVSNVEMGHAFEELIRQFAELSNETAGEHFTPREVIALMVDILFQPDDEALSKGGVVRSIFDPAAGTGGMLSVAEDHLRALNSRARLVAYGQELNPESFAICKSDMLIKGQDVRNIRLGNSFSEDGHVGERFDYMLTNPPYGVEWKKVEKAVRDEHERLGDKGRFGPGLPRISDGSLLFVLHLLSKMKPTGSRIGIILNGSPLFSGAAGSGESEIRRHIIEHDWLEAIVALPTDMFYNTGIATYIWVLTNCKAQERAGKVQLINAVEFYRKLRKSLGSKRRELGEDDIARIVRLYGDFEESGASTIVPNNHFGYRTITVERPLRMNFQVSQERLARLDLDEALVKKGIDKAKLMDALKLIERDRVFKNRPSFVKVLGSALAKSGIALKASQHQAVIDCLSERDETADVCTNVKGRPEPDTELRDTENVPLGEDIQGYFEREVKPYVPESWIDESKTKVGYDIPFTRLFHVYVPPRSLEDIGADLTVLTNEIIEALDTVAAVE